jgi:redox-sensitive bicupin YhaK (pirin superfamily)
MDYFRPANERGSADRSWLQSQHTFSFANYYDPKHMGFSVLRVINDDRVQPGAGFGTHSHRNMEIISYVLEGGLEHKDSMGNIAQVRAGEIQRMSAGTGVTHSEYNASNTLALRFLQIWIEPNTLDTKPGYEQIQIEQHGQLTLLMTREGGDGVLSIDQDMRLYRLQINAGEQIPLRNPGRAAYLHGIGGKASVASYNMGDGDGLGLKTTQQIDVVAGPEGFTALWFELPAPA